MKIAIYLRKSRADEEMERQGQGETLSKHRKALLKFAKERNLDILDIKEEIVSGESLFHRPKMLELLKEVQNNQYEGVLVMDMQRLGRGDMQDQGIILKTFKDSNTKIITPQKTYDLQNDWDEEYTEFEAFMSRKELKMITRRMQGGRVRSVEDGNYLGTNPPLGYDIYYIKKTRTLKPNKDASIVKMIYEMYCNGNGSGIIANYLNNLGYKSATGKEFDRSSIIFILKNPVYIGKITWMKKSSKKSLVEGKKREVKTRSKEDWIIVDGKHEAIVDQSLFDKAQEILSERYHVPYQIVNGIANPLAGIVVCGICGNKMVLRKYSNGRSHLMCTKKCGCKSSRFDYVENHLLDALKEYYNEFTVQIKNRPKNNNLINYEKQIDLLKKDLAQLNDQKITLHDLVEQKVYDYNTFIERSNYLSAKIDSINEQIEKIQYEISRVTNSKDISSDMKYVLDVYDDVSISVKNTLLKKILIKVEYTKLKTQKNDDFKLRIYPRVYL